MSQASYDREEAGHLYHKPRMIEKRRAIYVISLV